MHRLCRHPCLMDCQSNRLKLEDGATSVTHSGSMNEMGIYQQLGCQPSFVEN
jgi:hypothetical protein